jgi:peptidoglycan pentaglycine glycine transferase (the first glycine)
MPILSPAEWENFLENYPDAHLLQSSSWAKLKSSFGWRAAWISYKSGGFDIGSQILFRRLIPGFSIAYMPKGPVYDYHRFTYPPPWSEFWNQVDRLCRSQNAILLKVEPDIWIKSESLVDSKTIIQNDEEIPSPIEAHADQPQNGFIASFHSIQPLRTIVINIQGDEDQILSRMKQKTRYNIKLSVKKGVKVHSSNDIPAFHKLMQLTGSRDGFGVHSLEYYQAAFNNFSSAGVGQPKMNILFAEFEQELLSALMVFAHGKRAWYLYGASSNEHRDKMPSYYLQWEAIRWARRQGCMEYDLWGTPDVDLAILEKDFTTRHEDLWGVYRFKRGFGGDLRRAAGPWDRVYQPLLYALYRRRAGRQPAHLHG